LVTGTYLTLTKTSSVSNPTINSNLTWNISYTVIGTWILYNVSLVDVLPAVFIFVSASTGYTYTGWVLSFDLGTLTGSSGGILTGLVSITTTLNTWAITGQSYINTVTWYASGITVVATGTVRTYDPTILYIPGGWGPYVPIPLPTPPENQNQSEIPSHPIAEVIQRLVPKKKILALPNSTMEYIPFYTQPVEAIKKYVINTPQTGVRKIIDWIVELFQKIL
jgi:uncharacterized repeat protein (TIGR01451 family)